MGGGSLGQQVLVGANDALGPLNCLNFRLKHFLSFGW
jgi:hypothetical protein